MSRRPTNANQAFTQGWRMVCVVPQKGAKPESEVLNFIFRIADEHLFVKFTYKGEAVSVNQLAFWVRGGDWTTPFAQETLNIARKVSVLNRFVKEIEGSLSKKKKQRMEDGTPALLQTQKDP